MNRWHRRAPALAAVALLGAALFLQGCETTPTRPQLKPASTQAAESAERTGDYVIAAQEYDRLAQASVPPQQQHYQLKAAEALIKAGQLRLASQQLRAMNMRGASPSIGARRLILQAQVAALEGEPAVAVNLLDEARQLRNLDPSVLSELNRVASQVELTLGNPMGAVKDLIAREQYMVSKDDIAADQMQLWKILAGLSTSQIQGEAYLTQDPVLAGWLDLALRVKQNAGRPRQLAAAIAQWKQDHPNHPASDALLQTLVSAKPGLIGPIQHIALLLPLTSPYAQPARAVADGFLGLYSVDGDANKPTVRVYDIGSDPADAPKFYAQAVSDGAQMIVGPLGLEAVNQVVKWGKLTVPTLLLTHPDAPISPDLTNVFQFGLPPEQEARQAAVRAYLDGHRQAAVLYPDNAYGQRMYQAFTSYWQQLGGIIVSAQAYAPNANDYSAPVAQLLNVTQSEAREQALATLLGVRLQFEPRMRQDVDCVFLAADARSGRLIKPQLDFYGALNTPVYSTSAIFTGKDDPIKDNDLDGVMFGDMPWMLINDGKIQQLRQIVQGDWPYAHTPLDRLYALGMDSYALIPQLNRLLSDDSLRFNGVTSSISLEPDGQMHRQLLWAIFRNGVPQLLDTTLKYHVQVNIAHAPGTATGAPQPGP